MIPDFKTYIGESIWADIHRRSNGERVRKEDRNKLTEGIEKTRKQEFVHLKEWRTGLDYAFAPCNFGADSYDEPGLYLNSEELAELRDLLADTEFEIASIMAWDLLINRPFERKKIKGYWYYIFDDGENKLYVPNFGYISEYYALHPEQEEKISGLDKKSHTPYGACLKDGAYYIMLYNEEKSFMSKLYKNNDGPLTDKFQVRLVKRIS